MSTSAKEEDSNLESTDNVQQETNENDLEDVKKFRPMQPVISVPQQSSLPDSTDSTPPDMAAASGPRSGLVGDSSKGGSFKMPIFKGPIRKISKVKSSVKSFEDSTTSLLSTTSVENKNNKTDVGGEIKKTSSKRPPAEELATPPPPYREPAWSGIPEDEYYLEVLKGGAISGKIGLNDHPFHLFGRLETNHVQLDHPSLSRYHAVLQYRSVGDNDHDPGFYLYDLGSTHGTTLNKKQIEANVYCRIQVGHMFKLAGSTRLYILQGADAPKEEKGKDLSIEQLKEMQLRRMEEKELLRMKADDRQKEVLSEENSNTGISWGMAEDADAESDLTHNPYALDVEDDKEAPYLKDPKKALRGFFEREGDELEYKVEEMGIGHSHEYVCKVVLPLDDPSGNPIVAEAAVSGKKKEAVLACALEACKILDRHGMLRQAKHESKKRKDKNWAADDYYDSDDDTFLDRTGEVEKKRIKRMRKAGAEKQESLTYDKLLQQLQELEKEMKKVEDNLATMGDGKLDNNAEDSLDAFMDSIKGGFKDRNQRGKLKLKLVDLRKEQLKLKKLINIAKPANMPELKGSSSGDGPSSVTKPKMQAMIGKMHGAKKFRFAPLVSKLPTVTTSSLPEPEEEEEEEEEEEDDDELDDGMRVDVKKTECKPDLNQSKENELKEESKSRKVDNSECSSEVSGFEDHYERMLPNPSTSGSSTSVTEPTILTSKGPSVPPIKGPSVHSDDPDVLLLKGPTLPPSYQKDEAHDVRKQILKKKRTATSEETTDEDIVDWVPPIGQTGDGRTSLNEKFGY